MTSVTVDTALCKRNKFAWHFVYPPPLVRINSACRFPCALYLQTLETLFILDRSFVLQSRNLETGQWP
jgi:hypothetical protein